MSFNNKNVLVTGGASFIGSHLCERLVELGAKVTVADNFSSGKKENLELIKDRIEIVECNLKYKKLSEKVTKDKDIVFHLAADHGGRGYISSHPADCSTNMALSSIVFQSSVENGVDRITFASSACVYPTDIQVGKKRLKEEFVSFQKSGGAFADEEYGWAKLMGELSLKAFHKQYKVKASSVRIFTAYGPRENETHAIIALVAKAFAEQDPFKIWGDGKQTRNFTYVGDIVSGLILANEKISDATAVNAGITDFISLKDAAEMVFDIIEWRPKKIKYLIDKPVGVKHRAADINLAKELTGWEPKYKFYEGLKKTIDWYINNKDRDYVRKNLDKLLMER